MERLDAVVAVDVDCSDINGIAETAVPIAGCVEFASRLERRVSCSYFQKCRDCNAAKSFERGL